MKRLEFAAVVLTMAMVVGFVACSSDEDDKVEPSVVPTITMTDANGKPMQVMAVGDVQFQYSGDGKLAGFNDGEADYRIDGQTFKMTFKKGYTADFALNQDGLVSRVHVVCDYTGDDGTYDRNEATMTYTYNDARQLTGMTSVTHYDYKLDEYRQATFTREVTQTNTWENGNLVSAKQIVKESDSKYKAQHNFHFEYGDQLNQAKQFPVCMAESMAGWQELGVLCALGLYGVGPANLPTFFSNGSWLIDFDGESMNLIPYELSFEINENGTIRTEHVDSNGRLTTFGYQYK